MPEVFPFFSVVIPVYNKASTIARTLRSVFAQTYRNYEVVIVDDGSTDESLKILNSIVQGNDNIKAVSQVNAGVSAARNRGIHEARGEWVAFLDADDIWLPGILREFCSLIKDFPSAEMVGVNYYRQKGCWLSTRTYKPQHFQLNFFASFFPRNILFNTSCHAVRKRLLIQKGGFNEQLSFFEDAELLFRLAMECSVAYSTIPLSIYTDDAPVKLTHKFKGESWHIAWPHIELLERLCKTGDVTSDQIKCGQEWLFCALSNAKWIRLRWLRVAEQFPALFRKLPFWCRIRIVGMPILFCRRMWRSVVLRVQGRRFRFNEVVVGG